MLRQGCEDCNITIVRGSISKEHIHMLVSCLPIISVSDMMQYLKGRSSKKLQEVFLELRKNIESTIYGHEGIFVEQLEM